MNNNQSVITEIALNKLVVSSLNVRKVAIGVDELSENIASHGLIQNLTAYKNGATFEVVAGGRRLTALQLLASQNRISDSFPVPVKVIDKSEALGISLSENTAREQMHPADEFDAFKTMIDQGQSVEAVSARFGVTPNAVNRRLRLANLAPSLLQKFRDGQIPIDKLMALATNDDHETQEAVWEEASDYDDASDIREAMLNHSEQITADDKLAVFVGLEAYEKAGGILQADLFGEENKDGYLIVNTSLLIKLANQKIKAIADEMVANESLAWVDTCIERSNREYSKYRVAFPVEGEISQTAQAQIDDVDAKIEALTGQMESLDEDDEDYYDKSEELQEEIIELEEKIEAIKKPFMQFAENEKPYIGKFIGLNRDGEIEISSELIRSSDEAKLKVGDSSDKTGATVGQATKADKPEHPVSLITALTAHRTIALQATIASEPQKAMVILVAKMLMSAFRSYGSLAEACKIDSPDKSTSLCQHDRTIDEGVAFTALQATKEKWQYLLDSKDILGDLNRLEQADLLSLMAYLTAISVETVSFSDGASKSGKAIGALVDFNLNDWFSPNTENYWGKLSKDVLTTKILEKNPKAVGLAKLKRGELAVMANSLYENSGYQPAFMAM